MENPTPPAEKKELVPLPSLSIHSFTGFKELGKEKQKLSLQQKKLLLLLVQDQLNEIERRKNLVESNLTTLLQLDQGLSDKRYRDKKTLSKLSSVAQQNEIHAFSSFQTDNPSVIRLSCVYVGVQSISPEASPANNSPIYVSNSAPVFTDHPTPVRTTTNRLSSATSTTTPLAVPVSHQPKDSVPRRRQINLSRKSHTKKEVQMTTTDLQKETELAFAPITMNQLALLLDTDSVEPPYCVACSCDPLSSRYRSPTESYSTRSSSNSKNQSASIPPPPSSASVLSCWLSCLIPLHGTASSSSLSSGYQQTNSASIEQNLSGHSSYKRPSSEISIESSDRNTVSRSHDSFKRSVPVNVNQDLSVHDSILGSDSQTVLDEVDAQLRNQLSFMGLIPDSLANKELITPDDPLCKELRTKYNELKQVHEANQILLERSYSRLMGAIDEDVEYREQVNYINQLSRELTKSRKKSPIPMPEPPRADVSSTSFF